MENKNSNAFMASLPATMSKTRFAMKVYHTNNRERARKQLLYQYNKSADLQQQLREVGYNPKCHMLNRVEMMILIDFLVAYDDFEK